MKNICKIVFGLLLVMAIIAVYIDTRKDSEFDMAIAEYMHTVDSLTIIQKGLLTKIDSLSVKQSVIETTIVTKKIEVIKLKTKIDTLWKEYGKIDGKKSDLFKNAVAKY